MSAQLQQWRVSTPEGEFETDFETLKQWISEGSVLPTDKVSKGSLGWIEAGRAPMLRAAFQGEASAPAPTVAQPESQPTVVPQIAEEAWQEEPPPSDSSYDQEEYAPQFVDFQDPSMVPSTCYNHPNLKPNYVCPACATGVCEACVKYIEGNRIPM